MHFKKIICALSVLMFSAMLFSSCEKHIIKNKEFVTMDENSTGVTCDGSTSKNYDYRYKYVENNEKILATTISTESLKFLSEFYFAKSKLSSHRISLDDIDKEYKVGSLRKVINKSGEVVVYNKYCDDRGNVIFLFSDEETYTPEFVLDYYRTIIDYSDEKRYYGSFDETYKKYRELVLDIDL